MSKYKCKPCEYSTNRKADYNRHISTKKHKKLCPPVIPVKEKIFGHENKVYGILTDAQRNSAELSGIGKKSKFLCKYCGLEFKRSFNMNRHFKKCSMKSDVDKTKDLERRLKEKDRMLKEKEKQLKKFEEYHNNIISNIGTMGGRNVNAITYIINQYQDAPHIEEIKPKDLEKLTFDTNRDVENVISYYRNKILADQIIEAITYIHKKKDPTKQSVWVTDVSRHNYIIKELLHDNDSRWVIDKKGVKSEKYLVKPILDFIRKKVYDYMQNAGDLLLHPDTTKQDQDIIMNSQKDGSDLIKEIDTNILGAEIIKKLSKHMHYEKDGDIPLIEEVE